MGVFLKLGVGAFRSMPIYAYRNNPVRMASCSNRNAKVTRLSDHLELHMYHPETTITGDPRPLLVFLPWLTATASSANCYRELYAARGFNVLTVWGKMSYFLWPAWAKPVARELTEYLDTCTKGPLLIHSMSIGAYLYAVTLKHIDDNKGKYSALIPRVRGHVYDSIVVGTLEEMATGVCKVISPKNSFLQSLIFRSCLLYFSATKPHTVVPYNAFIDVCFNSPVKTPKLCFYSLSDELCCPDSMKRLMNHWRDRYDLDIMEKSWEKSPHAAHLRHDPETYQGLLDVFLKKLELGDISPRLLSKL
ncbi:uncharacterized protein [Diadema antillarum]|uniref:uncharacterized protein n=1 Tax=Diadema antillarum TaxID=105358 RepID=UPI003A881AEE